MDSGRTTAAALAGATVAISKVTLRVEIINYVKYLAKNQTFWIVVSAAAAGVLFVVIGLAMLG